MEVLKRILMSEKNKSNLTKIELILIILIGILLIATIWVILSKISPPSCCSCPPSHYDFYPLYKYLALRNRIFNCECLPNVGCSYAFLIIPSDLIILIIALSVILVVMRIKRAMGKK